MSPRFSKLVAVVIRALAVLLILKIVVITWISYRDYMPPNFQSDFLAGREGYFFGTYQWAFFPHIVSGPVSLLLGMLLLSDRFRTKSPLWHRRLGKVQVANVLLIVAPSGLWMAWYAAMGPIAAVGFAGLAFATGATVALGWRTAVKRRIEAHRRWMNRCFVLLCSAVVVRVNGGLGLAAGIDAHWFYVQIAWTSWLVPLALLELFQSRWSRALQGSVLSRLLRMQTARVFTRAGR